MKNKIQSKPLLTALLMAFSTVVLLPFSAKAQPAPQLSEAKKMAAGLAVTTLSKQLSLDPASIGVIHVSVMNWPDSSLGCPQPGVQYLQVVTRGSLVLLRANMKAYRVHIGNKRAIICDKPMKSILPLGNKTTVGTSIQNQMQRARKDLANKLGISVSNINILKVESMTWPNSALGCAVHKQDSLQAETKGFKITMEHNGQKFMYHTDQQKAIPCPPIERE